jgi:chromosome segregation ATPase
MTEQERREAVAAVPVHERQVEAAQERVDGAAAKVEKFAGHLDTAKTDLRLAEENLAAEQAELEEVKTRADAVLAEGPVSISGIEVAAYAGVASAAAAGKGGNN